MILLVEGPDKAGKTAIVQELAKRFECPIKKHSYIPDRTQLLESAFASIEMEEKQDPPRTIVWDRFHYPSDLVYNPVVQNEPSPVDEYADEIQERLQKLDTVIIYVNAPLETITKRYEVMGGDVYLHIGRVPEIQKGYESIVEETCLNVICTRPYYERTPEQIVDEIIEGLRMMGLCK